MKYLKMALAVIFSLITAFAAAGENKTEVYGKSVLINETSLVFDGGEIQSVELLKHNIKQFTKLKSVNMGSFAIDPMEGEKLKEEFPGIEFKHEILVQIFGKKYPSDADFLDFSKFEINDISELELALPSFHSLKKISMGENLVEAERLEKLENEYPDVEFDVIALYDVYGRKIREDGSLLNLNNAPIDEHLEEKLSLLTNLKRVELYEQPSLTLDQRVELVKTFPGLSFGWDYTFMGDEYDSNSEELILKNVKLKSTEEVEKFLTIFPNIKFVDMSYCGISNEDMAELRSKFEGRCEIVWTLKFGIWEMRTDATSFSVLVAWLDECRIIKNKDLELLKYTTNLQALDLGHQAITDITAICEYCPELRILILADNKVKDITPISKLKHLHYVEFFWGNKFSDLSPLAECKELVDINISYVYPLRDFSALYEFPMLERLWIEHLSISNAEVEALRKHYPNAKIVNIGKGSVDNGWRTHHRYYSMIYAFRHPLEPLKDDFMIYG